MLLIIEGQPRAFVPIRQFRKLNRLPEEFGMTLFCWKEETTSDGMSQVQEQLAGVRAAVLKALTSGKPPRDWLTCALKLELVFRRHFLALSSKAGLSLAEAEYISACFGDLCETYVYSCLRARSSHRSVPYFQPVYLDWISDTVRISQLVHSYIHNGELWRVQVVTNAFGYVGLIVDTTNDTHYVEDNAETRAVSHFIVSLLLEVAAYLGATIARDEKAQLPAPLERVSRADLPFREGSIN